MPSHTAVGLAAAADPVRHSDDHICNARDRRALGRRLAPGLSVVIPVYRSEQTVGTLIARLSLVLPTLSRSSEIILVDDGSCDGSWDAITSAAGSDRSVRGIRLARNFGQHNALLAGIRAASCDRVAILDDDLQNPPEQLAGMLKALTNDVDIVYGVPARGRHALSIGGRLTKWTLQNVLGAEGVAGISTFVVFRTSLRDAFRSYGGHQVSINALLAWSTSRIKSVPVEHHKRLAGRTSYGFAGRVRYAANMAIAFTDRPLRLATFAGSILTAFGAASLIIQALLAMTRMASVPELAVIASMFALFGGVQLLTIGIMGEYLASIHSRTMDRPTYVIGATVGHEDWCDDYH